MAGHLTQPASGIIAKAIVEDSKALLSFEIDTMNMLWRTLNIGYS